MSCTTATVGQSVRSLNTGTVATNLATAWFCTGHTREVLGPTSTSQPSHHRLGRQHQLLVATAGYVSQPVGSLLHHHARTGCTRALAAPQRHNWGVPSPVYARGGGTLDSVATVPSSCCCWWSVARSREQQPPPQSSNGPTGKPMVWLSARFDAPAPVSSNRSSSGPPLPLALKWAPLACQEVRPKEGRG